MTPARRRTALGRLAFLTMALVTTWSVWAWAKRAPEVHEGQASSSHVDHEGPAPMNWVDFGTETPPYIAMVINFGILVAGYYLLGKKPIGAALQNRRASIAKEIEDAQRILHEAETRAKMYQSKLDNLAEDVQGAREALVRSGEAERDRIVMEAEAKAERMRKDAQFMVEQEMKQIRQDLWRDAVEAAVSAAETLLKTSLTQADQERLAEDYLTGLTAPKSAAGGPGRATEPPAPRAS